MTPEEIKAQLDNAWKELKGLLTQQANEIKTLKETKDDTAQKITTVEKRIEEMHEEFVEAVRKSIVPSQELTTEKQKSLGQQFVESEQFKSFVQTKSRMSAPMETKSLWIPRGRKLLDSASLGAFSPMPYASFADMNLERVSLRDLLTVVPTQEGSIEYVRTVGFAPVMTHLDGIHLATVDTLDVDDTTGFVVGQTIRVGTEFLVIESVDSATQLTTTAGLVGNQADNAVVMQKFLFTTAEGGVKPEGGWRSLTVESASMRTLATTVDATRQVMADQTQLQALIDNQLTFELGFSEHYQIIYGDGTSPNLSGILDDADHQELLWSNGQVDDTKIDTLRRAITLVTLARYPADGIAIHPTDWEDIELAKGSDGHYLWISITQGGEQVFFRLPVCVTEAVAVGTAIVGSWKLGATLFDREQANVRIAEEHSDYFKRNMISVLAEERIALAVHRPEAFVEVTFDSAPAEPPI